MDLFGIQYFPVLLTSLVAVFAAREYVTFKELLKLKYLFTPLVTALIAGFVILSIQEDGTSAYRVFILTALLFSLIADTLLMIVEVNLLQQGIVYFLLAHVMYIIAFSLSYEYRAWNIAVAAVLLVLLAMFYRGARGSLGSFRIPILVYAIVLCTMLFYAISFFNRPVNGREALIITGALLFVLSDFLLAYLTFVKPHKRESVIVWAVYAPAQLLIALSCFN
jgi:uncharacterized membrane protein YhhN